MCNPILVTLLKMRPHFSQSSHENATPSSDTFLLASYKEVTPPPRDYQRIFHPANRVSFCLLEGGGEKEVLPESRRAFEVTAVQTSGLVNLVFYRQTGFLQCGHPLIDKPVVVTEPIVISTRLYVWVQNYIHMNNAAHAQCEFT